MPQSVHTMRSALLDVNVRCRHTMEELQQLVETAKQAVPGVDDAIAAAIDRKLNPVGRLCMQNWQALCCAVLAITTLHLVHDMHSFLHSILQSSYRFCASVKPCHMYGCLVQVPHFQAHVLPSNTVY